jgi:hydrogenase maturation protein HypF
MNGDAGRWGWRSRVRMRVEGTVHGDGFRQFVHGLATTLHLGGFVANDAGGVVVEAEGEPAAVEEFVARLPVEAPPVAAIDRVAARALRARGQHGFAIILDDRGSARPASSSADVATCHACLDDMADPANRRYRYPFTSCADCGPRYTIARDGSCERAATTMAGFPLCAACTREYDDPADRHFRAPALCCPSCGPRLELTSARGRPLEGDPVAAAGRLLQDGFVVAVKEIGGYHLAVDAVDERAVSRLRARKRRDDRPFPVLVADLDAACELCAVSQREAAMLGDPAAPIVLLERTGGTLAPGVAPGSRRLGVMVANTPLHHLLVAAHAGPLVLAGGHRSDGPILSDDADARSQLSTIADAFLTHDRPIHTPVGDSVVRVAGDRPLPLRRARGHVPHPLPSGWEFPRPILAVGAQRASTVCLAEGRRMVLSHHIGDLDTHEIVRSFTATVEHLSRLCDVRPTAVAHDLHPEYLSTRYAHDLAGVELVGVQHHHAHVAACLAEHGMTGPAIGVAFDGGGYGSDGTIWGGEIVVADLERFTRVGHLQAVPLPGGAAAVREPWRMAMSYLHHAYGGQIADDLAVLRRHRDRWHLALSVATATDDSPLTSGAARLFDAVAALVGVRDTVRYRHQAAIELEHVSDPHQRAGYRTGIIDTEPFVIRSTDLIRAVVDDLRSGVEVPTIAARFHAGVAGAIADACQRTRARWGLGTVALSGGMFHNALLVDQTVTRLEADGFRVLTHARVPPNDGGISFGQVAVAGARDRAAMR